LEESHFVDVSVSHADELKDFVAANIRNPQMKINKATFGSPAKFF